MKKTLLVTFFILSSAGWAYPQKKEIIQLQADAVRLSQQLIQLQSSVDDKNAVIRTLVEKLYDQVLNISQAMLHVGDAVESVKTQSDEVTGELRVLMGNLRNNVNNVSAGLDDLRSRLVSISQEITAMKTSVSTTEGLMRSAIADYLAGNYDLAISGLREYLDRFPDDPRSDEVQLYLGNSYYDQKKYDQAVLEYDLLLQKYPDSDKTVNALYMKGLALAEQNERQEALTYLKRVVSEFPQTSEAANAQQKIRQLRGGQ